jgi:hypothetical protein
MMNNASTGVLHRTYFLAQLNDLQLVFVYIKFSLTKSDK